MLVVVRGSAGVVCAVLISTKQVMTGTAVQSPCFVCFRKLDDELSPT